MTTKIRITGTKLTFELSYRNGHLYGLKIAKGKLTQTTFDSLPAYIPIRLSEIETFAKRYPALKYEDASTPTTNLNKYYVAQWFIFYDSINHIAPKFSSIDGKAMRGIQQHLEQVSDDNEIALATWKGILGKWHTLPEFYRKKTDLAFINAKLNEIITHLKDEQHPTNQARRDADDLRRGH